VPQVRFWVWRYSILPSGLAASADDLWAFAVDMAVCVPATFAVAAVSYHVVEQPAAAAARRLGPWLFGGSGSKNGDRIAAADVCKSKAA
jgi:peptidoglycan/LPS O-acetylase OafA/YrhL